jgi:hypothetical protein
MQLQIKKHLNDQVLFVYGLKPLYAGQFTGFQSASADVNAFRFAVDQDANFLNVDTPSALVFVVSMRNMVACTGGFTRNKAFARHELHLLKNCFLT